MTELDALWAAVGTNPEDQLPRLVLADWYEERVGEVDCGRCDGQGKFRSGEWLVYWTECPTCSGAGRVSNGNAEMGAALRATADRVPWTKVFKLWFGWWCRRSFHDDRYDGTAHLVERSLMVEMSDSPLRCDGDSTVRFDRRDGASGGVILFPSATDAIRDLCRAWVAVNCKQEVPA